MQKKKNRIISIKSTDIDQLRIDPDGVSVVIGPYSTNDRKQNYQSAQIV